MTKLIKLRHVKRFHAAITQEGATIVKGATLALFYLKPLVREFAEKKLSTSF